jgi:DNA-binding transcriptional MerR regulator
MVATLAAPQFMESGEVARTLGVSVEALRYWEREGIIAPPLRTTGGRRLFTPEQVEEIREAREAKTRAAAPDAA